MTNILMGSCAHCKVSFELLGVTERSEDGVLDQHWVLPQHTWRVCGLTDICEGSRKYPSAISAAEQVQESEEVDELDITDEMLACMDEVRRNAPVWDGQFKAPSGNLRLFLADLVEGKLSKHSVYFCNDFTSPEELAEDLAERLKNSPDPFCVYVVVNEKGRILYQYLGAALRG